MLLAYVFKMNFEGLVKNQNVKKCIAVAQNVVFVLSERTHFANLMLGLIWGWASIASSSLWKLRSSAPGKLHWAVSWIPGFPLYKRQGIVHAFVLCMHHVQAWCPHAFTHHMAWTISMHLYALPLCKNSHQKKNMNIFLWNSMRNLTAMLSSHLQQVTSYLNFNSQITTHIGKLAWHCLWLLQWHLILW